jgi:hypothetical protein
MKDQPCLVNNGVLPMNDQHNEPPILCTRADAARLLACSVSTIIRLQREGWLSGLRLSNRPNGQFYFRRADILALAKMGAADAD